MVLASAVEHYATQKAIADRAGRRAVALWGVSQALAADALAELQTDAAASALLGVDAMLEEQNLEAPPAADTVPASFARGTTAALVRSAESPAALVRLFATLTADAGRSASGVGIAVRPRAAGHVRYLAPPSCVRCAILAGRFYRWSSGFQRHPRCDCQMIPTTRLGAPGLISGPREAFEKGQITGLSRADADALDDGADMGRVVNIRAKAAGLHLGGHVATRGGIPTPEGIYRMASDRGEAIRLLGRFGYIH